jgi:hypothetical protein
VAYQYVQDGYFSNNGYIYQDILIDWGTKTIFVPRVAMVSIQTVPTQIYRLDLNDFRLRLKDLEDDEAGMAYPDTHNHNTTVEVGGVSLARVIEIINGYTVTFEDGQYAVNLVGANSNVGDVVNVNQVSVRSANSAGLTDVEIQRKISFGGEVYLDTVNGTPGTAYPIGTQARPALTLDQALTIAAANGVREIVGNSQILVFPGQDVSNIKIRGVSTNCVVVMLPGSICANLLLEDCVITGDFGGNTDVIVRKSIVGDVVNFNGVMDSCLFTLATVGIAPGKQLTIGIGGSLVPGNAGHPLIDMNAGQDTQLIVSDWFGGIEVLNCDTPSSSASMNISAGKVTLNSSVSDGDIVVRGVATVIDNSTGGNVTDQTVNSIGIRLEENGALVPQNLADIAQAVWAESTGDNQTPGSFGEQLGRKVLTVAKFIGLR